MGGGTGMYSEIAIVLGMPVCERCACMTDLSCLAQICVNDRCVYMVGVSIGLSYKKRHVVL